MCSGGVEVVCVRRTGVWGTSYGPVTVIIINVIVVVQASTLKHTLPEQHKQDFQSWKEPVKVYVTDLLNPLLQCLSFDLLCDPKQGIRISFTHIYSNL